MTAPDVQAPEQAGRVEAEPQGAGNEAPEGAAPVRQRGRASSERALIDAATELFAEHGPNAVTVRAIAAKAGVNHGLVHHYFGSKLGLIRAVLDDIAEKFRSEFSDDATGLPLLVRNPRLAELASKIAARMVLDEVYAAGSHTFPSVVEVQRNLRNRFGVDDDAMPLVTAQVLALTTGWMLLEPAILRAVGLEDADREMLRVQLVMAVARLAALPKA